MRRLAMFSASAALSLVASASFAQSRAPIIQVAPSVPEQQRQFCNTYQDDVARHNEYAIRLAAAHESAAGNPIAERAIRIARPEFEKLFRTKQAAVMGNGSFQGWIGRVKLMIGYNDEAFIAIEFDCRWTEYGYKPNIYDQPVDYRINRSYDALAFGTAFVGGPRFGIPTAAEAYNSLASIVQGETVAASGQFFCAPPSESTTVVDGGCSRDADGVIWATLSSLRSIKTGTVWRLMMSRGGGTGGKAGPNP